ncbi:MAG: hypothetical protein HYX34_02400 [Actinobacteria bacterium]|nr:hypothetical protein [Actinomycetota bacterium]
MANTITAAPRAAIDTYWNILRLPVALAGRVTGHAGDDDPWAPRLAFDSLEASAKSFAAGLLGDDALRDEAERLRARVSLLRHAAELDTKARRKEAEADDQLARRRRDARETSEAADERAQEAAQRLEKEEEQRKQQARSTAASRKRTARQAAARREDAIDGTAREAELRRLREEREALEEKQRAATAKGEALRLDEAAKTVRRRRRAAS